MKKKISIWKLAAGIVLTGLACFFIYNAIFVVPGDERRWRETTVPATGTVAEVRETYRNRAYCDHLVIRFAAGNNQAVTFTPYDCYSKGVYRVGQAVRIRYNPDNPSSAYIDLGENDRSTSIAMIAMGAVMLIAGIAFLVASVKKEAPAAPLS